MTCIVGIIGNGFGVMGSDSIGSNGYSKNIVKSPKIFKKGDFLIGYTSSFRMGQLLQYEFTPPDHPEGMETEEYMATLFVNSLRELYKEGGFSKVDNNVEKGGICLVMYRGRLYEVQQDFSVLEYLDGYSAIGSGEYVAMGAMYACTHIPLPHIEPTESDLRNWVTLSLEAAQAHTVTVSKPFHIEVVREGER